MRFACILTIVATMSGAGCASLGGLSSIIQPPRFEQAEDQPAQLRILGPSRTMPVGGAGVRLWLKVTNPNAFGFTLSTINAALSLEGSRAADADFPLGLPLSARQESVIPLDLSISFADLPGLASALRRLAVGGSVPYDLEGTVGVDAGRLGTPTFGPMLLTRGEMRVVR
ncbi:MAG TPA: LEA type 2 family protein [Vicinamibacterales bacterium]|nr:LEA type 2 family protein [Vicinamibacterales bacterium]